MALGIIAHKPQKSTGEDESTLALKPIGSHSKSETEGTSGSTKWTSVQQKLLKILFQILNLSRFS